MQSSEGFADSPMWILPECLRMPANGRNWARSIGRLKFSPLGAEGEHLEGEKSAENAIYLQQPYSLRLKLPRGSLSLFNVVKTANLTVKSQIGRWAGQVLSRAYFPKYCVIIRTKHG